LLSILSQAAIDASQDPKTALAVGATTATLGFFNISNVATLLGIVVSIVVICTVSYKAWCDHKEHIKRMEEFDK